MHQLLRRNVKRFRGGLVFKAHRLSEEGSYLRLIDLKCEESDLGELALHLSDLAHVVTRSVRRVQEERHSCRKRQPTQENPKTESRKGFNNYRKGSVKCEERDLIELAPHLPDFAHVVRLFEVWG